MLTQIHHDLSDIFARSVEGKNQQTPSIDGL
jgi:hypothetical protein